MKRTYQPLKTKGGRKVINARRAKGRKRLAL
jgi:ribosomal protein L34